jgi:hypothetical protein
MRRGARGIYESREDYRLRLDPTSREQLVVRPRFVSTADSDSMLPKCHCAISFSALAAARN